jgi:hypothetical protein
MTSSIMIPEVETTSKSLKTPVATALWAPVVRQDFLPVCMCLTGMSGKVRSVFEALWALATMIQQGVPGRMLAIMMY